MNIVRKSPPLLEIYCSDERQQSICVFINAIELLMFRRRSYNVMRQIPAIALFA